MAKSNIHPYIPSPGVVVKTVTQFRKAMPAKVDASTLKRLSLAPNNESMVLGVLKFLGFIDDQGNRTQAGKDVFLQHDDAKFAAALEKSVRSAYKELFELRGDDAWSADRDTLIGFFRATDATSALTATRQALAFETLAALAGHGEVSEPRTHARKAEGKDRKPPTTAAKTAGRLTDPDANFGKSAAARGVSPGSTDVALTVRVEINLPAQGDQETYDRIFRSIKANLLNG